MSAHARNGMPFHEICDTAGVSLALTIFAEVACAALIVAGLLKRAAALVQVILMGVAFFIVRKASLARGPSSGELVFTYLAGFVTLFLAGAGRFSFDATIGAKKPQK